MPPAAVVSPEIPVKAPKRSEIPAEPVQPVVSDMPRPIPGKREVQFSRPITRGGKRRQIHHREGDDILPRGLLIKDLQRRFEARNPDVDPERIDWESVTPFNATFSEGIETLSREYPGFDWGA